MRKNLFTKAQMVGMIKEKESGMPTAEVCRKYGHSQSTLGPRDKALRTRDLRLLQQPDIRRDTARFSTQ